MARPILGLLGCLREREERRLSSSGLTDMLCTFRLFGTGPGQRGDAEPGSSLGGEKRWGDRLSTVSGIQYVEVCALAVLFACLSVEKLEVYLFGRRRKVTPIFRWVFVALAGCLPRGPSEPVCTD
jgi:hypothetical protein